MMMPFFFLHYGGSSEGALLRYVCFWVSIEYIDIFSSLSVE